MRKTEYIIVAICFLIEDFHAVIIDSRYLPYE